MEQEYLKRRMREETLAALKAAHPRVRLVHIELADRYRALVTKREKNAPSS